MLDITDFLKVNKLATLRQLTFLTEISYIFTKIFTKFLKTYGFNTPILAIFLQEAFSVKGNGKEGEKKD